jgi:hypothetical protein
MFTTSLDIRQANAVKNYTIKELSKEEFFPLFDMHKSSVFEATHSYSFNDILSAADLQRLEDLGESSANRYELYLGAYDSDNQFIGWSWGFQENAATFYMVNSGVLQNHRRKGIYSGLIDRSTKLLSQKGFQLIYSRHCATNNAVIIPKLKAGFIISKMEIDDRFGVLIHLHFYTNDARRRIMDYRSGQLKPDAEIRKLFKLV